MKNKIVLGVFFAIALILSFYSASATQNVSIVNSSVAITGTGGIVPFSIDVQNTGNETISVNFVATSYINANGHDIDIEVPQVLANVSASQTKSVSFNVSLDNYAGDYTAKIRAEVVGATTIYDEIPLNVTINNNNLSIERVGSGTISNTTDSGVTVTNSFTIKNNQNDNVVVSIAADALKDSATNQTLAVTVSSQETINYLSDKTIPFSVTVAGSKPAGTYSGNINVSYGSNKLLIPIQVSVNPTKKIGISTYTTSNPLAISGTGGDSVTSSFILQKAGNLDVPGVNISYSDSSLTDDDGDKIILTFSPQNDINLSSDKTISVVANISNSMDPGTYTTKVTATDGTLTTEFAIKITVQSFISVSVDVDPEEVKPGETFTIDVEVSNDATNLDLADIDITVSVMDGSKILEDDSGDDMEETTSIGDLDAGDDSDTETFEFTMPYDVGDGNKFTIKIKVEAENADKSTEKFTITNQEKTITVEKEDHEVEIYEAKLRTSTLKCEQTHTYLDIGLRNIGSHDEDVELTVQNTELSLDEVYNLELSEDYDDDDNEQEVSTLVSISNTLVPGDYEIIVKAYYNKNKDSEQQKVVLKIADCTDTSAASSSTTSSTTTSTTTTTTPTASTPQDSNIISSSGTAVAIPPTIIKGTKKSDLTVIVLLILCNALVLAGVITAAARVLGRR